MAKCTFDIKHISAHGSTPLMIRGYQVQVQIEPTPSPLHCDLEHIQRIPILCMRACVRARVCMWVIFILEVVFRMLRLIKDMGCIMLKEALFLFFLLFFFVFQHNYYHQQQFLQQNKNKKEEQQQ